MRISLPVETAALTPYLGRFIALAGAKAWRKRRRQLVEDMRRSEAHIKIVADYHWLEIFLSEQADAIALHGRLTLPLLPEDFAVLHFAGMVVEVFERLTSRGQNALQGRIRSALSAETGFAALYLEMDIARRLFDTKHEVEFPDLEGVEHYDLRFSNGRVSGEVECKSLSADAGRKIHRKDFYRLMEKVQDHLMRRAESGSREVLLVTLMDRLPSESAQQQQLCAAIRRMVEDTSLDVVGGDFFSILREEFGPELEAARSGSHEFYGACNKLYAGNIHVAGPMPEHGRCVIVMRSVLEDDPSKPWLEAMEKAATQFSGERPAFIAVQFNDLAPEELMAPNLRRRAETLSGAVLFRSESSHVAATFFCPYRGMVAAAEGVATPAFAIANLDPRFPIDTYDYPAFLGTLSDSEFAQRIGARDWSPP